MVLKLSDTSFEEDEIKRTKSAMENARRNEKSGSSPGAGLSTADEQAEAAYADLILTSMDQRLNFCD